MVLRGIWTRLPIGFERSIILFRGKWDDWNFIERYCLSRISGKRWRFIRVRLLSMKQDDVDFYVEPAQNADETKFGLKITRIRRALSE